MEKNTSLPRLQPRTFILISLVLSICQPLALAFAIFLIIQYIDKDLVYFALGIAIIGIFWLMGVIFASLSMINNESLPQQVVSKSRLGAAICLILGANPISAYFFTIALIRYDDLFTPYVMYRAGPEDENDEDDEQEDIETYQTGENMKSPVRPQRDPYAASETSRERKLRLKREREFNNNQPVRAQNIAETRSYDLDQQNQFNDQTNQTEAPAQPKAQKFKGFDDIYDGTQNRKTAPFSTSKEYEFNDMIETEIEPIDLQEHKLAETGEMPVAKSETYSRTSNEPKHSSSHKQQDFKSNPLPNNQPRQLTRDEKKHLKRLAKEKRSVEKLLAKEAKIQSKLDDEIADKIHKAEQYRFKEARNNAQLSDSQLADIRMREQEIVELKNQVAAIKLESQKRRAEQQAREEELARLEKLRVAKLRDDKEIHEQEKINSYVAKAQTEAINLQEQELQRLMKESERVRNDLNARSKEIKDENAPTVDNQALRKVHLEREEIIRKQKYLNDLTNQVQAAHQELQRLNESVLKKVTDPVSEVNSTVELNRQTMNLGYTPGAKLNRDEDYENRGKPNAKFKADEIEKIKRVKQTKVKDITQPTLAKKIKQFFANLFRRKPKADIEEELKRYFDLQKKAANTSKTNKQDLHGSTNPDVKQHHNNQVDAAKFDSESPNWQQDDKFVETTEYEVVDSPNNYDDIDDYVPSQDLIDDDQGDNLNSNMNQFVMSGGRENANADNEYGGSDRIVHPAPDSEFDKLKKTSSKKNAKPKVVKEAKKEPAAKTKSTKPKPVETKPTKNKKRVEQEPIVEQNYSESNFSETTSSKTQKAPVKTKPVKSPKPKPQQEYIQQSRPEDEIQVPYEEDNWSESAVETTKPVSKPEVVAKKPSKPKSETKTKPTKEVEKIKSKSTKEVEKTKPKPTSLKPDREVKKVEPVVKPKPEPKVKKQPEEISKKPKPVTSKPTLDKKPKPVTKKPAKPKKPVETMEPDFPSYDQPTPDYNPQIRYLPIEAARQLMLPAVISGLSTIREVKIKYKELEDLWEAGVLTKIEYNEIKKRLNYKFNQIQEE